MLTTHTTFVEGLRQMDRDVWDEFVALYEPLLFSYVRKNNVPEHEAGDVVQNIWIALWKYMPRFRFDRTKGRFRTWLYKIAYHAAKDYHRHGGKVKPLNLDELADEIVAGADGGEEEWERLVQARALARAIEVVRATTDPKTWACFEQHKLKFRPARDVGAELGLSENSVNVNASRVLKKIRDRSQQLFDEEVVKDDVNDLPQ
jgi:RNA polymerase sigma-70 factor (ECF subfamily)